MNVAFNNSNIINDNIISKLLLLDISTNPRSIFVATSLQSVLILSISSLFSVYGLPEVLIEQKMIFKFSRPPPVLVEMNYKLSL